jgi:hypothetical protein
LNGQSNPEISYDIIIKLLQLKLSTDAAGRPNNLLKDQRGKSNTSESEEADTG